MIFLKQLFKCAALQLLFLAPLSATEHGIIQTIIGVGECLSTCCFFKIANIGYDTCCNNISCKDSVTTSPEYKGSVRWFNAINSRCCNLQKPSCCIENDVDPRASLTIKQKYAQCLYNCCLIKTLGTTRACYNGQSCSQIVQNFGEYKMAKNCITCCLSNPYYTYGIMAMGGCLLCLSGSYTIMHYCSNPSNNSAMNEEN